MSKKDLVDKDFWWLFSRVNNSMICLSSDYMVADINDGALDIFDVSKKKVLHKSIESLFAPYGLGVSFSKSEKKVSIIVNDESIANNSYKSKQLMDLHWKVKKLSDDKKDWLIVYVEEESKKESEAENNDNCLDLGSVISCMPGYVYWVDKNNHYLGCNDNNARFLGFNSGKEVVGLTYEDVKKNAPWLSDSLDSWKEEMAKVMCSGKPQLNISQKSAVMFDGREFFFLANLVPLFDKRKNVIGALGISFDITESVFMEREFGEVRKKVKEAEGTEKETVEKTSEYMRMLAGGIAHEIRTPLAIIGINSDLLMMNSIFTNAEGKDKKEAERCFESIKYAIKLASYIVDNTLVMLKTLASRMNLQDDFECLPIASELETLIKTYPFLAHEKSVVNLDLGKGKNFFYYGDRILTQHIFFNLMKNALQAIKEAGKGEIKITLDKKGDFNLLKFRDSGIGMSKEEMLGIFDQFTTGKSGGGSGLGLSFCKMVMNIYGGDITCNSKKGKYAEFVLSFPKVVLEDS